VKIPSDKPRSDAFRLDCGEMASLIKVPAFVPNDQKAKEIQSSVEKENKKDEEEKKDGEEEEEKKDVQEEEDNVEKMKSQFFTILEELTVETKKTFTDDSAWIEKNLIKSEEFEKDDDANYHIDFMYSMGNCRAACYKLERMDWI